MLFHLVRRLGMYVHIYLLFTLKNALYVLQLDSPHFICMMSYTHTLTHGIGGMYVMMITYTQYVYRCSCVFAGEGGAGVRFLYIRNMIMY